MNTKKSIGIIVGVIALVLIMRFVGAAGTYPTMNPPQANPAAFLTISSTPQAKSGSLALGATVSGYTPTSNLDVQGTAVVDILGSLGTGWTTQNFKVGGVTAPSMADPKLLVEGSRIRSTVLANQNEQTICADDLGRLKLCSTPPAVNAVNGACDPQTNGQMLTAAPTSNLCLSGNASSVSGSGPWSWTCNGINGGTDASCTTTSIPMIVPPTPVMVYWPNGASGGTSPHDGISWQPVTLPGTSVLASEYEVQTFNPKKNFVNSEWYDGLGEYSQALADDNDWKTLGVLNYATAPANSAPAQAYQNWMSSNPTYYGTVGHFESGTYNIGGTVYDNDCFSSGGGFYFGCAYRVRARATTQGGIQYSNWSNPIVLYDAQGPELAVGNTVGTISCATRFGGIQASVGIDNILRQITCSQNTSIPNQGLELSWHAAESDNQKHPFLTYTIKMACNTNGVTNPGPYTIDANVPSNPVQGSLTTYRITPGMLPAYQCNSSLFGGSLTGNPASYFVRPNNDGGFDTTSPGALSGPNGTPGTFLYPVERGAIQF